MNKFELTSAYQPTGDQPEAIAQLTEGVREGLPAQTLLGVTGSGKTFTIANVIANINKPTLILSHNKTLAAQLYSEFKDFSKILKYMETSAPLRRTVTIDEVGNTAAFLLSDYASGITGDNVYVDAGFHAVAVPDLLE